MTDLPMITVVLPAYNEEALIYDSLRRVCDHLRTIEGKCTWEVIAIDDGSVDATGEIMEAFADLEPRVRVLRHYTNFNLGQAFKYAFNNARGDYIITLDADLSYGPEHIELLLDAIQSTRAKIVIASPYHKDGKVTGVPRTREFMSRRANRILSHSAKGDFTALTSMARAYDRQFLETLDLKAWDFEINTEIIYKAELLRARIIEIPAHLDWTGLAQLGESRRSSLRVGRSIIAQAFSSFLFRPFVFFIGPGLTILVLALWTIGWAVYHTIVAWASPEITSFSDAVGVAWRVSPHSFVVGGISLIIGIQLVSLGVLSAQSKRYFEEIFHLGTTVYREQLGFRPVRAPLRPVRTDVEPPLEQAGSAGT